MTTQSLKEEDQYVESFLFITKSHLSVSLQIITVYQSLLAKLHLTTISSFSSDANTDKHVSTPQSLHFFFSLRALFRCLHGSLQTLQRLSYHPIETSIPCPSSSLGPCLFLYIEPESYPSIWLLYLFVCLLSVSLDNVRAPSHRRDIFLLLLLIQLLCPRTWSLFIISHPRFSINITD